MVLNSDAPQPEPTRVPLPPAVQPRSRLRFFVLLGVAILVLVLDAGYWYNSSSRPIAIPTINKTQPSPQPQLLTVVVSDLAYGPNPDQRVRATPTRVPLNSFRREVGGGSLSGSMYART